MALFAYAFRSIHVVCDLILNIKRENTLATDSTTTNFHTHTDGRKSDVGYRCIYTHACSNDGGGAVKSKTFFPQHYQRAADELNVKFMDFFMILSVMVPFSFSIFCFFYFVPKKTFVRNKNILFPNQKYAFRWTKGYQRRQRTKKVVKWRFWTISISIHTYWRGQTRNTQIKHRSCRRQKLSIILHGMQTDSMCPITVSSPSDHEKCMPLNRKLKIELRARRK